MKFRVRYTSVNDWVGETQYAKGEPWVRVTNYCFTQYGAKHALRKWYKKHVINGGVAEEMNETDLMHRDVSLLVFLAAVGFIAVLVGCILF
ncbi:hypothetical protein DW790_05625 [Firmicutes bacterium AM31-12AC]|nr:hypothetical protein DW790_05625 [Firmicutes bacterium AM31-12AC]